MKSKEVKTMEVDKIFTIECSDLEWVRFEGSYPSTITIELSLKEDYGINKSVFDVEVKKWNDDDVIHYIHNVEGYPICGGIFKEVSVREDVV